MVEEAHEPGAGHADRNGDGDGSGVRGCGGTGCFLDGGLNEGWKGCVELGEFVLNEGKNGITVFVQGFVGFCLKFKMFAVEDIVAKESNDVGVVGVEHHAGAVLDILQHFVEWHGIGESWVVGVDCVFGWFWALCRGVLFAVARAV